MWWSKERKSSRIIYGREQFLCCALHSLLIDEVCLLVGCLTSQQHASVSQGRIYSDNFTCCHTEIEVEDQTFHLTQSQYTDTGPAVPALTLFVGCWTSQQHTSVSRGWICSDNFTCCHTELEVAGHTFHLTQSQYTNTGPTRPSTDPITPGAWQGSHWSANL